MAFFYSFYIVLAKVSKQGLQVASKITKSYGNIPFNNNPKHNGLILNCCKILDFPTDIPLLFSVNEAFVSGTHGQSMASRAVTTNH